jgi:hypothetical protein
VIVPTREVPWLRVVAEAALIVASILLAFGIDAWWEGRQDNARAADVLVALRTDVVSNLEHARRSRRGTEGQVASTIQARRLLDGAWATVPRDSVLRLVAESGYIFTLEQETATYDQVVATGDLRLLDQGVRDALSTWRVAVDEARTQETLALENRTGALSYILEHLAWAEIIGMVRSDRLDGHTRFSNDLSELASDRRLDNLLTYRILLGGDLALEYRSLEGALAELLEALDAALAE